MNEQAARFPRRELLTALAGFGSVAALGWTTLPNLPILMRGAGTELPDWATTTAVSASAYRTALLRPDLLASVPCFCGCVTYSPPHRSLLDCFVRPAGGFEPHAAGCSTCQEEALAARRWADQGLELPEVRRRIIASFEDRGPSTDHATSHATA
jgi:hypothetical protein